MRITLRFSWDEEKDLEIELSCCVHDWSFEYLFGRSFFLHRRIMNFAGVDEDFRVSHI
jgi:hypothetical protein